VNFALVGVQAGPWTKNSPADGATVFACSGDTVTLAWEYVLGEGERAGDTKWKTGANLDQIVAYRTDGHFFVPQQQYTGR
jgi:hypothetical protein